MPVSVTQMSSTRRRASPAGADLDGPHADDDVAALGELDGVADQVDEDLAQPLGVAEDGGGHVRLDPPRQVDAFAMRGERQAGQALAQQGPDVERRPIQLQASRFDLREVEDVVDDPQQRRRRAADGVEIVPLIGRQRRRREQFRHAQHAVHRRADLVAHVGHELALGPARGLGGFLREAQVAGLCGDALAEEDDPGQGQDHQAGQDGDQRQRPADVPERGRLEDLDAAGGQQHLERAAPALDAGGRELHLADAAQPQQAAGLQAFQRVGRRLRIEQRAEGRAAGVEQQRRPVRGRHALEQVRLDLDELRVGRCRWTAASGSA